MSTNNFSTKATLLLVSSLTVMSGATIAPALPAIQDYFSGTEDVGFWVRFVLTVPALFIVLASPAAGAITDRWGRKKLLLPGLVLYALAGSSGIYLDSLGLILAGRALLGIAVAGLMTTATTLIADYYDGKERAKFMGWQAAFMSFGGIIFLTAGGLLAEQSWRWPFSIYLFALLLLPMAIFALPKPTLETSEKETAKYEDSAVSLPWKMLGFIYSTLLVGSTVFYFVPLQIPFYLETQIGSGPSASGMAIAVSTLFGMFTSLTYGKIRSRLGYVTILGVTFLLIGIGYLLIGTAHTFIMVIVGLAFCGLGMGLLYPNLNLWLTSETPVGIRGRAVSGFTTAIFLGQFISPFVSQPIVETFDLNIMFWTTGGLLFLSGIIFILRRQQILSFTRLGNKSRADDDLSIPSRQAIQE